MRRRVIVLLVLCVMLLFFGCVSTSAQRARDICIENTPKDYELTNSYYTNWGAGITCFYETVAEIDYHLCHIEIYETENHGFVKLFDWCKYRQGLKNDV